MARSSARISRALWIALLAKLPQRAHADRLEPRVDVGHEARRERRLLGDVLEHDADRVLRLEGHAPGQHLEEDDAHGVEIAARVELLASPCSGDMYSGVPTRKPAVVTGASESRSPVSAVRARVGDLRDAEVADLDDVLRPPVVVGAAQDHDVLGLEIAMHDAHVVRDGQRGQRLHQDVGDARRRERPVLAEHAVQARARRGTPSRCRAARRAPRRSR